MANSNYLSGHGTSRYGYETQAYIHLGGIRDDRLPRFARERALSSAGTLLWRASGLTSPQPSVQLFFQPLDQRLARRS